MKTAPSALMALASAAPGGLNAAAHRAAHSDRADRSAGAGERPAESPFARLLDRSRDATTGPKLDPTPGPDRRPAAGSQPPAWRTAEPADRRLDGRRAEERRTDERRLDERRLEDRRIGERDREATTDRTRESGARSPIERVLESRQAQRRADDARARDQATRDGASTSDAAATTEPAARGNAPVAGRDAAAPASRTSRPGPAGERKASAASAANRGDAAAPGGEMPLEASAEQVTEPRARRTAADDVAARADDPPIGALGDPRADAGRGASTPGTTPAMTSDGRDATAGSEAIVGEGRTGPAPGTGTPAVGAAGQAPGSEPGAASASFEPTGPGPTRGGPAGGPATPAAGESLRGRPTADAGAGPESALLAVRPAPSEAGTRLQADDGRGGMLPATPSERFEALLAAPQAGVPGASATSPSAAAPAGSMAAPAAAGDLAAGAVAQAQVDERLDSPGFAPSLAHQVSVLTRDGIERAEIRLNPVELGPVSVQIHLDGLVARVEFTAEQAPTRSALESSLPQLAAALREAGFTLGGGGVFQQAGGRPGSEAQGRSGDRGSGRSGRADDARLAPLEGGRSAGRAAQGQVDLYA